MANGKLLLVDDKKENLLALRAVLEDHGYEIFEAESGAEALVLSEMHAFFVILLDVQMPLLNGFETALLIRKSNLNSSTPIIFVTAIHRSEAYEQKGYDVGAVDYLFKPVNTEILKAKVAIFAKLHSQQLEIQKQAILLHEKSVREKENELLKESLKARDQFLSMASHELKTPITPLNLQMQTFLKMVQEGTFQSAEPERLARMLKTSYNQVERLAKTIDDLLDVSRFSTGHTELHLEKVRLDELVRKVLGAFSEQLRSTGCELWKDIQPGVEGIWDPFRIEQVFINLLSNCMKYGAGKPIVVRARRMGSEAELYIQDHGIGIAKEDQARIFKRFERAVSPQFYGGLGLGLFIACEIVRLHQGHIHVESVPGFGATFIVRLPLNLERTCDSALGEAPSL